MYFFHLHFYILHSYFPLGIFGGEVQMFLPIYIIKKAAQNVQLLQ